MQDTHSSYNGLVSSARTKTW